MLVLCFVGSVYMTQIFRSSPSPRGMTETQFKTRRRYSSSSSSSPLFHPFYSTTNPIWASVTHTSDIAFALFPFFILTLEVSPYWLLTHIAVTTPRMLMCGGHGLFSLGRGRAKGRRRVENQRNAQGAKEAKVLPVSTFLLLEIGKQISLALIVRPYTHVSTNTPLPLLAVPESNTACASAYPLA